VGNADVVADGVDADGVDADERPALAVELGGSATMYDKSDYLDDAEDEDDGGTLVAAAVGANFLHCSTAFLRSSCWRKDVAAEELTSKGLQCWQHHCVRCYTLVV
jgi:hypothetical protein